ncbi:MAG: hypothetical protein Q8R30_00925 [bacterium]|nr:hypothetical protein [bacterium]MDZ4286096.1 hypothetical protein [Candidatus Sungbacteria bacterium]
MQKFPMSNIKEFAVFKKLTTPSKIQDFLDALPVNFEEQGDTCASPLTVLQKNKAHCIEGAMVAAAAFWYHGQTPFLMDLKTTPDDFDHVVTLFKEDNHWGALSKTNHAVLRYRDPIYRTIRELAMSYFNEYFLDSGKKTLRSYSAPFNLLEYDNEWLTSDQDLWGISEGLDTVPHFEIIKKDAIKRLRLAHPLEIEAGKLTEWKRKS